MHVPRYKLTIAYDGTDFCGWQKQLPHEESVPTAPKLEADDEIPSPPPEAADPSMPTDLRARVELRTVQSVVERAVRYVVREPVIVMGASRTDAGVHANGQVAAFTCSDTGGRTGGWPADRGCESLMKALNSRLPDDVLVKSASIVDAEFDPIRGAARKQYTYSIWNAPSRSLWHRRTTLHVYQAMDVEAMHRAAQLFVGEHDFAGFAASGHGRKTTVRTVFSCDVTSQQVNGEDGRLVTMRVCGNGFLWNMVRIMAGTLCEIGRGRMPIGNITDALRTQDRRKAGPTVPPHGLCLDWIEHA